MDIENLLDLIINYKDSLLINSQENEILLLFTFVFGNFFLMIIATVLCFMTKKIPVIYDIFGIILGSSIIAMFLNLLVLMFLVLIFNSTILIYNTGLILTIIPIFYIIYKFNYLNKLGISITQFINNVGFPFLGHL